LKEKIVLAEACAMRNDFSEALYHRMMADMAHRILKELEMDDKYRWKRSIFGSHIVIDVTVI
jgi:hypothetical protein